MTTTTSASVKRSWASIVKGSDTASTSPESELSSSEVQQDVQVTPDAPHVLQPSKRGERWCHCFGEVLVILGHYGWIMPFDEVDCPDIDKTAGRVYLHKRDMPKGVSLVQGDTVSFFLYVDDQGLGAEGVRLEKQASGINEASQAPLVATSFRAEANEFVPGGASSWNVGAREFVPPSATTAPSSFSAEASEFVPGAMNVAAQEFVPATIWPAPAVAATSYGAQNQSFCAFNLDLLSDSDDDSDDEGDNANFSGNEGDKESCDSDKDSNSNESVQSIKPDKVIEWSSRLDSVVRSAPWKTRAVSSDEGSTGAESDSEVEDMKRFSELVVKLKFPASVRPPPGLSLPAA